MAQQTADSITTHAETVESWLLGSTAEAKLAKQTRKTQAQHKVGGDRWDIQTTNGESEENTGWNTQEHRWGDETDKGRK